MPSKVRLDRIADRIQRDLTETILFKVNDPRIANIFVTGVKVDRELAFADIYISAVEGSTRSKEVLEGLEHASGFLRTQLAAQIALRTFPKLRFHWDPTPEQADHMEKILADLRNKEKAADQAE